MEIQFTKREQLRTNVWSGGTTTQLVIYPQEATYKNLDFIFRISTATIDVEESAFTSLPNVSRVIMVLKGELTITHKNQYSKLLKKFETDAFSGNWVTTGIGKGIDFNVMTRGSANASVFGFSLKNKSRKEILLNVDVVVIYLIEGRITLESKDVLPGDVVFISKEKENEKISILAIQESELAIAYITY